MELYLHQILAQKVIKIVEILGDLASSCKIQSRLQVRDDQNRVVDVIGPQLDVVLFDRLCSLPQVLNHLFIEQDHEADSRGAAYVGFAIGAPRIRHDYPVAVPVVGAELDELNGVDAVLPLSAPISAVTSCRRDG